MKKIKTPEELLSEIAAGAEDVDPRLGIPFETAPISAQAGQIWTYNRWDQNYSMVFDAHEEIWGPQCYRLVSREFGKFVERKGYLKYDPMGTNSIKAVVTQGEKGYGDPLPPDTMRPAEGVHFSKAEVKETILKPLTN